MPLDDAEYISIKLVSHLDSILNLWLKTLREEISVILKFLVVYYHNISQG